MAKTPNGGLRQILMAVDDKVIDFTINIMQVLLTYII